MQLDLIEKGIDPVTLEELRGLPLAPGRPLIAVDCDEVMVHFAGHLARWLSGIGYRMQLTHYQLEGAMFAEGSDAPLPFDECLRLIDRFFDEETISQEAIDGAPEALARLAERAQVVVLTNVPRHARGDRVKNLARLGMDFPVIVNAGGKGRALAWMAHRVEAPAAFIDDSAKQLASCAKHAPEVTRVHFGGAEYIRHLLPDCPEADARIDDWETCEAELRRDLGL